MKTAALRRSSDQQFIEELQKIMVLTLIRQFSLSQPLPMCSDPSYCKKLGQPPNPKKALYSNENVARPWIVKDSSSLNDIELHVNVI